MVLQQDSRRFVGEGPADLRFGFGKYLDMLLVEHGLKQSDVYLQLGWSADKLSLLVRGQRSPLFDDLFPLAKALKGLGVAFTLQRLHRFVLLASQRIVLQKTHKDRHSDEDWERQVRRLAEELGLLSSLPAHRLAPSSAQILETAHLIKREAWREEFLAVLDERRRKKLVVLRGAPGVGKSSELSWLVVHLSRRTSPPVQVVLYDCRSMEANSGSKVALRLLLKTLLAELGCLLPDEVSLSLDQQTALLMDCLEQFPRRLIIVVDHGECALEGQGQLAVSWERFFSRILRGSHRATLILATCQWPGWYSGEDMFVGELSLPKLSLEESVRMLQLLGLQSVPVVLLRRVAERADGIPQALEWIAALVRQPLAGDEWEEIFVPEPGLSGEDTRGLLTRAVERLLAEPYPFASSCADDLAPLLQRIIENQHLSPEARLLLEVLSVAAVPLAQPALAVVCPGGTRPIKELRRASLLTLYEQRLHANAVVASAVIRVLNSDDRYAREEVLIGAYTTWLRTGMCSVREAGGVVADLATLLLKHYCLLAAAQLLIRYGWLSFNLGHTRRLAECAAQVLDQEEWPKTEENTCGALLLHCFLSPFLGKQVDAWQKATDYSAVRDAALEGRIVLHPPVFVSTTHNLMQQAMNALCFEEAQALLDVCCAHVERFLPSSVDLQASLFEKRAWMLGVWSEYRSEQGDECAASELLEQALALYSRCCALLDTVGGQPPLTDYFLRKRHARDLNFWGYYLLKARKYEPALQALRKSLDLQEQGFSEVDGLAPVYGDISQALIGLGRFQEALYFDEKAYDEAQRLANAGYTFSKEELHVYRINRGVLYLRLGRIEEAEALLRGAIPLVHLRRRSYKVAAQRILKEEIEMRSPSPHYQLDWRWVDRYRELASFDGYWWLAAAGPFTEDEKQQWEQLFSTNIGEAAKEQLEALIDRSRVREQDAALVEQREPRFSYPAIDIVDVRCRVANLQALQIEIDEQEPNAIVRRLYYGTIEEELNYLRFIEATYEGDSKGFWEHNLCINPKPTPEDMSYALSRVRHFVVEGVVVAERGEGIESERRDALRETSSRLIQFLRERLCLSLDWSYDEDEAQELLGEPPLSSAPRRMVSAQTAKRFFEAALRESGYEGWQVVIDRHSAYAHIEQALCHFYLPESAISLQQIKDLLSHELLVHVARCVSGQRSILGLLGIHTEHSLETEEGLGAYYEIKVARQTGQPHDETGIWFGTLATGLASGVLVPPQRFLSLVTFFEEFIHLYRLLKRPDQDALTAQKLAHKHALVRGLRTYRGLPNLQQDGMCNCKDAHYVPGLRKIEHAVVEQGESVLDELAVGVVAMENLSLLRELGIVAVPQPLRQIVQDPGLDAYILSFDEEGRNVV